MPMGIGCETQICQIMLWNFNKLEKRKLMEDETTGIASSRYVCSVCHYVYDEDKEEQDWEKLPEDWECPECCAPKSMFSRIKKRKRRNR